MYEHHMEALNSDGDALEQECCLVRIAVSGTQSPTHLGEKIQEHGAIAPEFQARLVQKENSGGDRNTWPPSVRRQVLRLQQQNDLMHGGKTEQAY